MELEVNGYIINLKPFVDEVARETTYQRLWMIGNNLNDVNESRFDEECEELFQIAMGHSFKERLGCTFEPHFESSIKTKVKNLGCR